MLRHLNRFNHISILKQYPKGINRFENSDNYIEVHNHPNIRNHLDFNINLRLHRHKFHFLRNQVEINELRIADQRSSRWYLVAYDPIIRDKVTGDEQLVESIEGKTLSGFLREGLTKSKRKDTHKLAYLVLFGIPLTFFINLYMLYFWQPLPQDEKKVIAPQLLYTYSEAVGKDKLERRRLEIVRVAKEYSEFLTDRQINQ